jgi:hypothetical protein
MNVNDILREVESRPKKNDTLPGPTKEDKSFTSVMDSISTNWEMNSDDEVFKLKKELKKLQSQLATKTSNIKPTANEKKILSAIRSESINQESPLPIISRNMFLKKYKVSSRFLDSSIKNLINSNIINREERDYTKNIKTFAYNIS